MLVPWTLLSGAALALYYCRFLWFHSLTDLADWLERLENMDTNEQLLVPLACGVLVTLASSTRGSFDKLHDNYLSTGHELYLRFRGHSPGNSLPWWHHQMDTFSAKLALCAVNLPVPGEFPAQRPVTRCFDVFFDLCLNKRLSKQSWGWWFMTSS